MQDLESLESRSQPTRLALASGHLKSGKTTEAEEATLEGTWSEQQKGDTLED